jgi:hypothetical protein
LAISCAVVRSAALLVIDRYVLGLQFLPEAARPRTGTTFTLRSLSMLGAAALLSWGVVQLGRARASCAPRGGAIVPVAAQLVFALGCALLLARSPTQYSALVVEDGPAENATIGCFLLAALLSGTAAWYSERKSRKALLSLACVAFVVITGEEISWGQRLFGIESSAVFAERNLQGETNLHNFATNSVEAIAYAGVLLAFVLLPFVELRTGWAARSRIPSQLLPPGWVILAAAPMAAFTFDQWDVIPLQLAFWTCVAVCVALAFTEHGWDKLWPLAAAATLLWSQALHLAYGHLTARPWDPTELRELAIAILALTWCAWLVHETPRAPSALPTREFTPRRMSSGVRALGD